MKLLLIISVILLSTLTESKFHKFGKSSNKSKGKIKHKKLPIETVGDSYSYAYASNDNYLLQRAAGFIEPKYMDKIPIHLNKPYTGVMGDANAYVTNKLYYNGSENLSAIHVECNVYNVNPQGCTRNSGCGWCGENNTCIPGSDKGPLAPCLRNTFLYTSPTSDWNPLKAGHINIMAVDKKGRSLITQAAEPDLQSMDVYNPYK